MNEKDDQIAHFGIVPKCLILRQFRNSPWTRKRGEPVRGSKDHTREFRGDRQRLGRVELLPASFAIYVGGGFCWRFNFSFGRQTISAGRLNFVDRLWLLSIVASEKMSKQAEREQPDLLWVSAVFVVIAIFFPQLMANVAADLFTR
jgi:hypothetical protein